MSRFDVFSTLNTPYAIASFGVHPQTIGYIERRQYNLSMALAFRLAAYFGLTLDAVFSLEPFKPLSNEVLKDQA